MHDNFFIAFNFKRQTKTKKNFKIKTLEVIKRRIKCEKRFLSINGIKLDAKYLNRLWSPSRTGRQRTVGIITDGIGFYVHLFQRLDVSDLRMAFPISGGHELVAHKAIKI